MMIPVNLKDTTVRRGGATSHSWYDTHKNCQFKINEKRKSMVFSFSIDSKGGGTTDIQVEVGQSDICAIFDKIVQTMPDNITLVPKFTLPGKSVP